MDRFGVSAGMSANKPQGSHLADEISFPAYEGMTSTDTSHTAERSVFGSLTRGFRGRCPNCGTGRLFGKFLKVQESCQTCSEELFHQRADDAPPYLTIFAVGHIVIPLLAWTELTYHPPIWVHMSIWPAAVVILALGLLQPIKGAVVGLQWALRMHGFGDDEG